MASGMQRRAADRREQVGSRRSERECVDGCDKSVWQMRARCKLLVELPHDSWWRPTGVGQPAWACGYTPTSPVLPLERLS
jgi:hypothetical protein